MKLCGKKQLSLNDDEVYISSDYDLILPLVERFIQDNNYITLNALSDIIDYGKNNGYSFKPLTNDTKMVTHRVVN